MTLCCLLSGRGLFYTGDDEGVSVRIECRERAAAD